MKLLGIFACTITPVEAAGGIHHGRSFQPSPLSLRPPTTFPGPHPKNPSIPRPIIDLGYERHQAMVNSTGHYNNFSNIPYAIPPLQDLRFSKPLPINNPSHLKPDPFQGVPHGWESEDCLLLDVVVPEGVAEAVKEDDDFVPLPVIVWIHGGGFAFGHKNQGGSPYSFFNASKFTPDSVAIRDKGILFTDIKSVENDDTFAAFIRNSLPGLKDEDVEYIVKYLYPLEEENTGVLHKLLRGANATAELSTICNAVYLLDAFGDEGSYKYVFGVEPGVHGQDVGFSVNIYNTGKFLPSTEIIAQTLQAYIVGFVKEGDPNRGLIGPEFLVYKDGIVILGSKENGSMIVPEGDVRVEGDTWVDEGTRERCDEDDGDDGSDGDGDGDGNDGNENNDDQDDENEDTLSSLKLNSIPLGKTSHSLKSWKNKPFSSQLQTTDSTTPTFSDIFKTKNNGKKVEWHSEWKADWIGSSRNAFIDTEGSDNKGKDSV
ncbi:hypothetical protein ABEW05_011067 [Botrytis cinerea]